MNRVARVAVGASVIALALIALALSFLVTLPGSARAQQSPQRAPAPGAPVGTLPDRESLNSGTVTVITAPIGGPMSVMGSDMAAVLDEGESLRVLPILGKGSAQNLVDIIMLKNIDMGFVATDALEFVKTEYNIPDIAQRVRYIAQLFHNDVHIVARREIRSLQDLIGKRVFAERSIGLPAARTIFRRFGIQADIDSQTDPTGGLQKLVDGQGDAWIASVSKDAPIIKGVKNDGRLHLLPIPYDRVLQDIYLPSTFSSEEYPNLVPPGAKVDTVAASTVLMVYNWPENSERYRRTARFVDALFGKIQVLQSPPRHPKWRDTVLSAPVQGLTRFKAAQEWLDGARAMQSPAPDGNPAEFRKFLDERKAQARMSSDEAARLYSDFLKWQRSKDAR
ncbi:TAXI family TRAP transporter solute-binding subunit [Bradyrhizobium oligotrophicum]|uniref:TAXI family TRAP transporter solute-binding subunit n=1 Tax=Bradyrhizobium oligotrophicum TaxID=44255 RepID=UPI003EB739C8